jgi:hypothetical protein
LVSDALSVFNPLSLISLTVVEPEICNHGCDYSTPTLHGIPLAPDFMHHIATITRP